MAASGRALSMPCGDVKPLLLHLYCEHMSHIWRKVLQPEQQWQWLPQAQPSSCGNAKRCFAYIASGADTPSNSKPLCNTCCTLIDNNKRACVSASSSPSTLCSLYQPWNNAANSFK